jgi:site-specific DNA-methyltransferase (adenine-specific)
MTGAWNVVQGECLAMLRSMADDSVDAVITDPPYSSGGFTRDDKSRAPGEKYQQTGLEAKYPTFGGDNRDQRSYLAWCAIWMTECVRVLKPGGYFMAFTDWRQLPVMTDAVQAGGVVWRGVVAWDKGRGARAPHKEYFKHQCEYVVWGTKGAAVMLKHDGPFDGCISVPVRQADKFHMTGKPVELMRALVRPVVPGGLVLDPFAGSGSTGVAALLEGRRFLGIEREADYVRIARDRLAALDSGLLAAQQAPSQASFEGVGA